VTRSFTRDTIDAVNVFTTRKGQRVCKSVSEMRRNLKVALIFLIQIRYGLYIYS
jgi:hypothetical protein